jgi:hypothetical protein
MYKPYFRTISKRLPYPFRMRVGMYHLPKAFAPDNA